MEEYVGRLAPTPSGHVHVGHAQTFYLAHYRARKARGKIFMRVEDLDFQRCKSTYLSEMIEDLNWFGVYWDSVEVVQSRSSSSIIFSGQDSLSTQTSPICVLSNQGGNIICCKQSERRKVYEDAWFKLFRAGYIYPSPHSRKDVEAAISAPHEGDEEQIFPIELRPSYMASTMYAPQNISHFPDELQNLSQPSLVNWRFKVPDGQVVEFDDVKCGPQRFVAGVHFGDFIVWRGADNIPSYELAVVVDDMAMGVTEVVRGEDLMLSTARQLLLYAALEAASIPSFYHCPLLRDAGGRRLAKRTMSKSLRNLRSEGYTPERIMAEFFDPDVLLTLSQIPTSTTISTTASLGSPVSPTSPALDCLPTTGEVNDDAVDSVFQNKSTS